MSENTQAKNNNQEQNPENIEIFALATDPIYIGTGGYTIGRVDNTIVRDPITNVPKIPGSSLAGTWRYYTVLETLKDIKDKQPDWDEIKASEGSTIGEKLEKVDWKENPSEGWKAFPGNKIMKITCAGQDNIPQEELSNAPFATDRDGKTGHCGHCIVCKGFGFSKKDISWQGQIFFSDLNIIFFPVFTIKGTKWITTVSRLKEIKLRDIDSKAGKEQDDENLCFVFEKLAEDESVGHINLGWLYLPYKIENNESLKNNIQKILENLKFQVSFSLKDIIIVPDSLFSHIVNSNLEVRTSVSIDPITGAAKEGALFTSEAIPRGTIFYGNIRIFDKKVFEGIEEKLKPLPEKKQLCEALENSRHYYETLGIGGMTTRGFGRLKITSPNWKEEDKNE
ncbi:RAMP superfamily CRISPR-associated protein [Persephonella sp. IF05-L8]|uniref:RAMP superfamily CRISPR-associated protein n=1 Tax=Persephonella sp. IF05-L8 TaxID=1158338 RepID=UPI00068EEF29